MKPLRVLPAFYLFGAVASAQELNWSELSGRPEFWPSQCTIKRAMKFRSGESVSAGQKVDVIDVQPGQIGLGTVDGRIAFAAKPEETDALEVARAAWGKLAPAQRALTYSGLLQRTDLWPYRVALKERIELNGNRKLSKGDRVILLGVEGGQLLVLAEKLNTSFTLQARQTDLLDQARNYVLNKAGAPSRVAEDLQGKLVDAATGRSSGLAADSGIRYFAFYRGAGWCGPCRQFSPTLLKAYSELKPKHPEFELIFLSADHSEAEMKQYVKEEGFPWRAVTADGVKDLRLEAPAFGQYIPQLIVFDAHGKLLIDSEQGERSAALKRLAELLQGDSNSK